MKKTSTIFKIVALVIALSGTMYVSAQIANLDVSKYYMIVNHNSKNAIAIDDDRYTEEGALIQQQTQNEFLPRQLWRIVPITDSTYYFINYGTGKALGLSDWRGGVPFWTGPAAPTSEEKDAALMVPSFFWRGSHRGIVQREFNPGDETQIWQPTEFPANSTVGDTVLYRMTMAMNLVDSGFSFNIWERRILPGYRNICAFPGTQENDLYIDPTTLYAYWFYKTLQDISVTADHMMENILVYSGNGSIIAKGELYGKDVMVYTILGTRIYSTLANASELNIPVKQGLYLVRTGNMITKVVVK